MCHKNKGIKLGILLAAIDVVCGIIVYGAPDLAHKLLGYLTHSTWQFTINAFDPLTFVIGAILWFAIGFVIGFALEKCCCKGKDCCCTEEKK
ncbi:MAG: DUF5676 family membrane protein [archaeon]